MHRVQEIQACFTKKKNEVGLQHQQRRIEFTSNSPAQYSNLCA